MRIRRALWMMTVAALLAPVLIAAQGIGEAKAVRVRVFDVRTLTAIPAVGLFALSGELLQRGDSSGVLRVRIGGELPFDGELRRVGYVASLLHVTGRETGDSLVVLLAPASAQALGTVEVKTNAAVTRYADFDRRRLSGGGGIFLTDSQISKGGHIRFTDLFRRFPSLKVIDSSGINLVSSARSKKPVVIVNNRGEKFYDLVPCVFQVVVDDVPMAWGFDMDLLNRDDIHGIEVYSGAGSIPVQYRSTRSDAMCGLIVIWTKSR